MYNEDKEQKAGGVSVTFSDLSYSVPLKKTAKDGTGTLQILDGLSGAFLPGRMTALMGPSGSGKTTLMDILAGRKNAGTIEGSVLMNGSKPDVYAEDNLKDTIGYVEQFDTLVGELTVWQMLSYTAELKLPSTTTSKEQQERVEEVIQMLDLESCRNTIIGNALLRGISGGQAKRVNIGLALITRPSVLFLDEPTSGLDSRTANEVVELLRNLAKEGRTVVCTIHSPTGHAFTLFDDLHMLHRGQTIFDAPTLDAQAYFEAQGNTRDPDCSLPEWLVDLTSELPAQFSSSVLDIESRSESETVTTKKKNFSQLYAASDAKKKADERRLAASAQKGTPHMDHSHKPPGGLRNLATLLKYRMVAHYKDETFIGTRFGDKIVFSLLILSLYYGIGANLDSKSITSIATLLYFICAICGYGAAAFVPSISLERALFYRELADGCYSPATYYAAKFIEEGVMASLTSLLFTIIVFFGCAFQGSFIIFFVTYYLTTMMGIILAYAIAAIVPTMEAANAVLPTYVTICMFFGGLIIVFDKIPVRKSNV
jgi:ATP-binding cassette subfamily G (WHITE) protein 2